ncbi:MAG: hypothetical protein QNJ45_27210 [Ardenticatenaceae bacterium]|nr:hypothetical protein [Ardenticatenaceae bacterium]
MNEDSFFLRVVLNAVLGAIGGALLLGIIGALLAGFTGFANGAIFGAVFGFIGGIGMLSVVNSISLINRVFNFYWKKEHGDPPAP